MAKPILDDGVTIPGPLPSRSVRVAAEYLAEMVQADHGTNNGKTALYWALIHAVMSHAKREPVAYVPPTPADSAAEE